VHIADTYGRSPPLARRDVAAITSWGRDSRRVHRRPEAAVGDEVMSGRGNPDGIHWNFEAHAAVAELMMKGLAEAGVVVSEVAGD